MQPVDPLKHSRAELTAAERAIDAMRQAPTLEEFEAEWRDFLNHLEKAWIKVERACQPQAAAFQPWQGMYLRLRKKDMLLRYLKQARDADNHSIQDIAEVKPGSQSYRFINPSGGHIKRMEIVDGVVRHYEGDPMTVEIRPPEPVAVRVQNRGEWFNPPTSHLDQPVESQHPVYLAELGLRFYTRFVQEAAATFFGAP